MCVLSTIRISYKYSQHKNHCCISTVLEFMWLFRYKHDTCDEVRQALLFCGSGVIQKKCSWDFMGKCGAASDLTNLYDAANDMDDVECSEAWEKDRFSCLGVNGYTRSTSQSSLRCWFLKVLASTLLCHTLPTPISSSPMFAIGNIWGDTIGVGVSSFNMRVRYMWVCTNFLEDLIYSSLILDKVMWQSGGKVPWKPAPPKRLSAMDWL